MFGRLTCRGVLTLLLLTAGPSFALDQPPYPPAVSVWSILPANPTTLDYLRVRNVFSGCDNGGNGASHVDINRATGRIDFYLAEGSDVCDTNVTDKITDSVIGYLPPGAYEVRFIGCGVPFDPEFPDCNESLIPRLNFVVADAGRPRHVIPASSPVSLLGLAAALALAGFWLARRR
jgi:hypothetical protein